MQEFISIIGTSLSSSYTTAEYYRQLSNLTDLFLSDLTHWTSTIKSLTDRHGYGSSMEIGLHFSLIYIEYVYRLFNTIILIIFLIPNRSDVPVERSTISNYQFISSTSCNIEGSITRTFTILTMDGKCRFSDLLHLY